MKENKLIFILACLLCLSFTGKWPENDDNKIAFINPVQGKEYDLSKYLGKHFKLNYKGADYNISVDYDKATGYNFICNSCVDTLFYGKATKFNGLFLLSQNIGINRYRITALCLGKNTVRGLLDINAQFNELQSSIARGEFKNLIMSEKESIIMLSSEKKVLGPVLGDVVQRFPEATYVGMYLPFLNGEEFCGR